MTGRTWTGELVDLREPLAKEAYQLQGGWAWRILESGTLVALRVRPEDFRKELRLARKSDAISEEEAEQIAAALWADDWAVTVTKGKPELLFLEHEPYSHRLTNVSEVPCSDCGQPTHEDKAFKVQRCTRCAMKAGAAESHQQRLL